MEELEKDKLYYYHKNDKTYIKKLIDIIEFENGPYYVLEDPKTYLKEYISCNTIKLDLV